LPEHRFPIPDHPDQITQFYEVVGQLLLGEIRQITPLQIRNELDSVWLLHWRSCSSPTPLPRTPRLAKGARGTAPSGRRRLAVGAHGRQPPPWASPGSSPIRYIGDTHT